MLSIIMDIRHIGKKQMKHIRMLGSVSRNRNSKDKQTAYGMISNELIDASSKTKDKKQQRAYMNGAIRLSTREQKAAKQANLDKHTFKIA